MPEKKSRIAERLKKARDSLNLTQQQVAVKARISRSALVHYEAGNSVPGATELIGLANALKITPNYILSGSEDFFASSAPEHSLAATEIDDTLLIGRVALCIKTLDRETAEVISALLMTLVRSKMPKKEYAAFVAAITGVSEVISGLGADIEKLVEQKDQEGLFQSLKGKPRRSKKTAAS